MTRFPDVIPEFVTVDAPERDVLPALARLLIDLDRRGETRPDGQESVSYTHLTLPTIYSV